jgi:aldose 1-epimerase
MKLLYTGALMIAGGVAFARQQAQAPYAARRQGEVVQLEDARSATVVSILSSVGNIAFELKVRGQNVLHWPYASPAEFKAKPAMAGIPFVGPWANRLDETAFYANGKKYPFDMSLGNVRGPIPIHGFLTTTSEWRVVEAKADARSAWATSRLDFSRQLSWMRQWPFAHIVEMTYRLQDGVLEVQTKMTNTGTEPMPVSIGFHPYFRLTDSRRDEWTLSVAARTRWLLATNKIPTGQTEPAERLFDRPGAKLADYNLDDVFSDLVRDDNGRATMTVAGKAQKLSVQVGPNYRAIVIWAPNSADTGRGSQRLSGPPNPVDRGDFICIEPMVGITDAVNLAHRGVYKELQSIPAGGTWQESFWIRAEGF